MTVKKFFKGPLQAILAIIVLSVSTLIFFIPIFIIGLMKLIPNQAWKIICTRLIDNIANRWVDINTTYINHTQQLTWHVIGWDVLDTDRQYLIVANHQSWADIVILQHLFNRKVPMLKFFIKDSLKWVPLLGFVWWAMGCPFMKRYSKDYLKKYPEKKGKDLNATRNALTLFQYIPTAIINFVEGTRFTLKKKQLQQSPYRHLLKPRAGGISFVISSMDKYIDSIIDTTIIYSNDNHSLWDLLCHRIDSITIHLRKLPIPIQFKNASLVNDAHVQLEFRHWLNDRWLEKDAIITQLKLKK